MITKDKLVDTVESSIGALIDTFTQSPHFFYTENDLHCFLYREILNRLPLEELQCKTQEGHQSLLLHKEYPTKLRYSAKNLCEVALGGARGHFDLCFWNPEVTENRVFRVQNSTDFAKEQHTFIAVEFDLIEGSRSLDSAMRHFRWDLLKLGRNEVEHGYQLVFVRNWVNKGDFLDLAKQEAGENPGISVFYIEANESSRNVQVISSQNEWSNWRRIKK